ncbi:MAG: thiamine pyrophosphate-dependent enzyme [Candidatus Paceibacterota bacterium]|jgi:thiamine pyrophosphate-dependent acetolactate synthase large subunit-like protein
MKRKEAIETIMRVIDPADTVNISTTGLISREVFEKFDSVRNIYVPGSLGLASSIGLGLAISCPTKRVVIIDGDASLLMNLGSIVTIGNKQPENLLHIVIDNSAYGSCNEEKSMSDSAHLDQLALTVGYRYVQVVNNQKDLRRAILHFRQGPGFIVAKIELGGRRDFRRPLELVDVKDRFMQFLHQSTIKGE